LPKKAEKVVKNQKVPEKPKAISLKALEAGS